MARSRLQRKSGSTRRKVGYGTHTVDVVCPTGMKPNPDKNSGVNCVLDIKAAGGSSKYQPGSPYASKQPPANKVPVPSDLSGYCYVPQKNALIKKGYPAILGVKLVQKGYIDGQLIGLVYLSNNKKVTVPFCDNIYPWPTPRPKQPVPRPKPKRVPKDTKYQPDSPYASKRPRIYGSPDESERCGNAPVYEEVRGLTRSRLTESTAPGRNYSGDSCSGNDDCGPIEICVDGECKAVGGNITAPTRHLQFSPMSRSKRRRKKFARFGR